MITQEQKDAFILELGDFSTFWLTLWGEFRGEPVQEAIAGGNVIFNRLHHMNYRSIKDVCLAKDQFSCWNLNDPNLAEIIAVYNGAQKDPHVIQAQTVARGIMTTGYIDNTNGALYYLTTDEFVSDKCPLWAKKMTITMQSGKTTFLR